MDTRFLGNLTVGNAPRAGAFGCQRAEESYYRANAPGVARLQTMVPALAAVCVAFVALGARLAWPL